MPQVRILKHLTGNAFRGLDRVNCAYTFPIYLTLEDNTLYYVLIDEYGRIIDAVKWNSKE